MRPGIDPKVDYAFKRVFGTESNRDVLIDLLNAVLQLGPGREVAEVELLNPFNDKAHPDDKLSVVDVKARDATGRQFVVEMQMVARAHHRQRVLYYATKLYSSQLEQGEDFDGLRPAYTISIVDSVVIPGSDTFHSSFVLRDAAHDLTFTDDFAVHMIELPKFRTAVGDLADRLADWCYFLRNADHLDLNNLPVRLTAPAIRKAMETLRMISQTERERIEYEDRLNRLREQRSVENEIAQARKEIEEGARRNEKEARRIEEEARRNENEARRVGEEARRVEEEARRAKEEFRLVAERQAAIAEQQAEHEARDRATQVGRITLALRLLNRPDVPRDELLARPLEDLRRLASQLELEALRGAPDMALWLCKVEPDCYSYDDLVRDGATSWDGVANPLARKNLRAMKPGDRVFFYHTGKEKAVVGEMVVAGEPTTDPTGDDQNAVAVEMKPVRKLATAVTLAQIKADDALADWDLVRLPRLSVMSVTAAQWKRVEGLAGDKGKSGKK